MFTGLIEDVGRIAEVQVTTAGASGARRFVIETRLAEQPIDIGASLSVDGTCLTVTEWSKGKVAAVAAAETLGRTTLGRFAAGTRVNLERPLRVGDRLGGHLVAGHVDGTGTVGARQTRGEALDVTVHAPRELLRYVVEKGSIAIDGISLTVNMVDERGFAVSLIPHTQGQTTLGGKAVGAQVNLEVDLIGKYVEKLLGGHLKKDGLTVDKLRENGFV